MKTKLFTAVALIAAAAAGFYLGQAWQRPEAVREGRLSALRDIEFDGYWHYLSCLSDDCEAERATQQFITERVEYYKGLE